MLSGEQSSIDDITFEDYRNCPGDYDDLPDEEEGNPDSTPDISDFTLDPSLTAMPETNFTINLIKPLFLDVSSPEKSSYGKRVELEVNSTFSHLLNHIFLIKSLYKFLFFI